MKIKDLIFQIKDLSFNEALEYCIENAKKEGEKTFVVTINPELIMLAKDDREYEKVLKSANLALCDGVGVVLAGKILGKEFKGRIHGVDLVEKLSGAASKQPITVGFLGGGKNVAQLTSECLAKKFPGLRIAFALQEWPTKNIADENFLEHVTLPRPKSSSRLGASLPSSENFASSDSTINHSSSIVNLSCDILFVAFGSPKQEKWIYENMPKIDSKVFIGVGGSFDFISGKVRRAPVWMRRLGLEWLFRLIIQPWRIKRQLALPMFVLLVLRERFL